MPINYEEFIVHRLYKTNISKLSNVNANDIVKIDKSAVEAHRKESMEEIYAEGYAVITHIEEAIGIVENRISKLRPPHWESIGYTEDENGNKVPNPPQLVDPDASIRESLEDKLSTLFSKLSDAQAANDSLDFMSLVQNELSSINYSLDEVNSVISNFVYKMNGKIESVNAEKTKYIGHAIEVMNEFEMTRGQYKNRTTNQLRQVPFARHKGLSSATLTPTSSTHIERNRKSTHQDLKGNVYLEYYQNGIYIIEVITLVHLDELKKKLLSEKSKNPVLYIKQSEISKLTSVEDIEKQMMKINYIIKKDKMGFFKKTIQGHIIFFENKKCGA